MGGRDANMDESQELAEWLSRRRRLGDDLQSLESIEWALWATLDCFCEKCLDMIELPHWSGPPWNGDVDAWAREQAPFILSQGWSMADDCFNLVCPKCRPTLVSRR
jgi:hypothetical protein